MLSSNNKNNLRGCGNSTSAEAWRELRNLELGRVEEADGEVVYTGRDGGGVGIVKVNSVSDPAPAGQKLEEN